MQKRSRLRGLLHRTLPLPHQLVHDLLGSEGVGALEFEAGSGRHGLPVPGKADTHAQLLETGVDGVEDAEGTTSSPAHAGEDLRPDLLTAVSHLADGLPPPLLEVGRLEDPVEHQLDRLLRTPHRHRLQDGQPLVGLVLLLFLLRAVLGLARVLLELDLRGGEGCLPAGGVLVGDVLLIEDLEAELVHAGELLDLEADGREVLTVDHGRHQLAHPPRPLHRLPRPRHPPQHLLHRPLRAPLQVLVAQLPGSVHHQRQEGGEAVDVDGLGADVGLELDLGGEGQRLWNRIHGFISVMAWQASIWRSPNSRRPPPHPQIQSQPQTTPNSNTNNAFQPQCNAQDLDHSLTHIASIFFTIKSKTITTPLRIVSLPPLLWHFRLHLYCRLDEGLSFC